MPKAALISAIAVAMTAFAAAPAVATTVSSTFDTGAEGWTVGNISATTGDTSPAQEAPTWNAAGGNPGGYISTTDDYNISAFIAPSSYTGNQSAFLGGTLQFSMEDADLSDTNTYSAVVLYSGGLSIAFPGVGPRPAGAWKDFTVPLSASGWFNYAGGEVVGATPVTAAAFASFLSNITSLAITADWHTGTDLTGLDSVALNTPAVVAATPLPAALPLFVSALGGLGLFGWRRKQAAGA